MKLKILLFFILAIFVSNCGFKVINQNYFDDYKIITKEIKGESRATYLLKNKLNYKNENAKNVIYLNIDLEKTKEVKEKNIQNEITKYEIILKAKVYYEIKDNDEKSGTFVVTKKGDYNVREKYSSTLNNEKNLVKNIIENISKKIMQNLQSSINDT